MASLSVKLVPSACLGLGKLPAGPLPHSTYVSSWPAVPLSPVHPNVLVTRRAAGLQVQAGGKKHAGKKAKKASHQNLEHESSSEAEQPKKDGAPTTGSSFQLPAPEGQDAVTVVPISQMKKVSQQSLQALAVGCIAEMHAASKEQVDNSGDGRDEEVIHQMRVALRRLRSVVDAFADLLSLPPAAQRKSITRILKALGRLRDADVMQETLDSVLERAGELPPEESAVVEAVRADMLAVREEAIAEVATLLRGRHTRDLMKANQAWLAQPRFRKGTAGLVSQRAGAVGPALAVQRVAAVFKHPAWSIDEISSSGEAGSTASEDAPAVSSLDSQQCAIMHDLRKKIRELRYMLELLAPVYSKAKEYKKALQQIVKCQSLLGDLQDLEVLSQFIGARLPRLPRYAAAMAAAHQHTWQRWLETRAPLLTTSGRAAVYEAVLWPNGKNASDVVADSDEEVLTDDDASAAKKTSTGSPHNGVGAPLQPAVTELKT
ncbi:hypothetical protein KFL_010270010 [Klebsormidium nitens]|uniref:CHAD domain-containing protein n=1 Tax=Klebsormidium nitens TaxID=105231 RepID=A0A1Y1IW36_KLENI|nr:hypothetical protein KFL_010270010 [Klebsormidium nitens]|eukprot:GAQ92488.1 hypothetical protein KFL_010270010 [Klebsormidium nitens]